MTRSESIIENLASQLSEYSGLVSLKVKQVYKGARENLDRFPCLVIEPIATEESEDISCRKELTMTMTVVGFVKIMDDDKSIANADADSFGSMLDLENEVKKAIDSDKTFSGVANHVRILRTEYDFNEFPFRRFSMQIEVLFRQTTARE